MSEKHDVRKGTFHLMANLVNLESATVLHGVRAVLSEVSLGVQTGDRIGVLGLNGSGKTTLLTVLAGLVPPDSGRVATLRGVTIEVVTQSDRLEPGASVRDIVLHTFGEGDHGWASDSSVRNILDGLGLANIGLDTLVDNLSGGERRRVALAAALVTDADLLILDEPTNHLDIEGVAWLADHLLARRSALVAVTHDRWFLDAVANTTWEVVDGTVHIREGGYSDWVFARADRLRLDRAAEETRKNLARKELAWLRRGAPARTAKPRFRIEAAEALIADVPEPRNTVELHSFARKRLGKDVLDLEDVTATVPTPAGDRVLLDDVTWRIGPGDRIGLVGINGSGKSTLLRVLVGDREVTSGEVKKGKTVSVGYLSQDVVELPAQLRLLEAVTEIAGTVNLGGKDISAGQLAERFGFTNEHQWTRVAQLSGGERRRLQLLRILMAEPNVLVLDEPTNDLDTDTLSSLEDLLDSWPGTLIVVSHDRYLIERVTDDVVALLGDGKITHLPGGIAEYLRRRAAVEVGSVSGAVGAAGVGASGASLDAATTRSLRKDLQRWEKKMESLLRKEKELHAKLATVGADYEAGADLNAQLVVIAREKDEAETGWMIAAEALEQS
nr:ABC-F family ATP-binding cassette domain-containing protein [Nakamurella sp. PAMC28650]